MDLGLERQASITRKRYRLTGSGAPFPNRRAQQQPLTCRPVL